MYVKVSNLLGDSWARVMVTFEMSPQTYKAKK